MEHQSVGGEGSEASGSVFAQGEMLDAGENGYNEAPEGYYGHEGNHDYVSEEGNYNYDGKEQSAGGEGSMYSSSHQGEGFEDENFDEVSLATSTASSKRRALEGYTFVEKKKAITWNPDVSYKKTLSEIRSQMTPAEIYRDRLETVGRLARSLRRLETSWAKDFDRWVRRFDIRNLSSCFSFSVSRLPCYRT